MNDISKLKKDLQDLADPKLATLLQGFFKTGKGQYGEGDVFLGIKVPGQRKIARKYKDLPLEEIRELLLSKVHEHRLVSLFILVGQFVAAEDKLRERIHKFYLRNAKYINNWDLVDSSAPYIVGLHLLNRDRRVLYKLARSKNLWKKRIAMLGTFAFIRNGESKDAFSIADILLRDEHDLIHKAVGWMLREAGKRCGQNILEDFLRPRYRTMPRTMLRYAIERFPENLRKRYLNNKI